MGSTKEVLFIFSEIHFNEENVIAEKLGKVFVCGNVSSGMKTAKYTRIINQEDYSGLRYRYPDMKIVARGKQSDFKFTKPKRIAKTK